MSTKAQTSNPYRESEGHPYRGHNELEPITLRGKAYGRSAMLEVMSQELLWSAQKGQLRVTKERLAIPFTDVNLFFAAKRRKASRLTWALIFGVLALIWGTEGSHDLFWWLIPAVISAAFGLAWWLRPEIIVELHSPGQSLLLVCGASMRNACFDAVTRVGRDQGGAENRMGLAKMLFSQARLAFGPARLLEAEYERQAGEEATEAGRAPFMLLCRRLAWLNTICGLLIPGALAAGYATYSILLIDWTRQVLATVAVVAIFTFFGFIILSIIGVSIAARIAQRIFPSPHDEER